MNINENKIKISGIACLSGEPKRTNCFIDMTIKNATLSGDIDIRDNENDTSDRIYKIKITPETEITILADNDILTAKKKGSQSQAYRHKILELYNQQYSGNDKFEDFDYFYSYWMSKKIEEINDILI